MKHRFLFSAALVLATPLAASAQFTAVITPPKKEQQVAALTPEVRQRADSVQKAQLTDMKVWVDSAASALTAKGSVTTVDSTVVAPKRTPVQAHTPAKHAEVANAKSARLPDTATPLPAIAVMGLAMVLAGVALMRKRDA